MGAGITCFFQDVFSLTGHKKSLLEASYGSSETSNLELFTKKSTVYSHEQFSQKVSP